MFCHDFFLVCKKLYTVHVYITLAYKGTLHNFLPISILLSFNMSYSIYRKYSDKKARANSVDSDEMPQNAASHQGLHCLPIIQQFLDRQWVVNCTLKF